MAESRDSTDLGNDSESVTISIDRGQLASKQASKQASKFIKIL